MADSAQCGLRRPASVSASPAAEEGDHFVITDEDVEREVVVFPATDEQARTEVVIEDEAQLCDFERGNLEIVLREMILDPVPDDISGFKW